MKTRKLLMSLTTILITSLITEPAHTCDNMRELEDFQIALVTNQELSTREAMYYNITGSYGYIFIPETCLLIKIRYVLITETGAVWLYNETIKTILNQSSLIIGNLVKPVQVFADYQEKYYISCEPLPLEYELDKDRDYDTLMSTWPSHTHFKDAVIQNVNLLLHGLETQRITILTFGETEDGIELVDALKTSLSRSKNRIVRLKSISKEMRLIDEFSENKTDDELDIMIHDEMDYCREFVKNDDLIVVHLASQISVEFKLFTLRTLFSKGADLDRENLRWMIYDMTFPSQPKAVEKLKKLSVLYSKLYLPWISMHWKTDDKHVECSRVGIGVCTQGLLTIKELLEEVFKNVTDPRNSSEFNHEISRYISRNEGYLHANPDSWDILHYPVNIIINMYIIKPVDHWSYFPDSECGSHRTVYSTTEIIQQYQKRFKNSHHSPLLFHSKNYALLGVPVDRDKKPLALVIPAMPFVRIREDGYYEGIAFDIFEAVVRELTGMGIFLEFVYELRHEYGLYEDNRWNGIFGDLESNESAVIGIGMISITAERSRDFEFTLPFGAAYLTFITERVAYDNMFQFLTPFTPDVWLAVTGVVVFSGFFFHLLQRWNPLNVEIPESSRLPLRESLWHAYLLVTQAGAPFGQVTIPERIYSVFLWFFALLIVGSYTGNLASFLAQKSFYNVQNLDTLILNHRKFVTIANSNVYLTLKQDLDTRDIAIKIKDEGTYVKDYEEGIERVIKDNYVFFGLSDALLYSETKDSDCSLYMDRRETAKRIYDEIAFPMKKNWTHAKAFKRALEIVRERGEVQQIYNNWLNYGSCKQSRTREHMELGWETSSGMWIVLALATVLSFGCLAIELCVIKVRQRRKSHSSAKDAVSDGSDNETDRTVVAFTYSNGVLSDANPEFIQGLETHL